MSHSNSTSPFSLRSNQVANDVIDRYAATCSKKYSFGDIF